MNKVISISFGELALKGGNRKYFEASLAGDIRRAIGDIGYEKIYKDQGKLYIEADERDFPTIINRVRKIFGIAYVSECLRVDKDIDEIGRGSIDFMRDHRGARRTFKVRTKRSDKAYPMQSNDINMKIGGVILDGFPDMTVDVHEPEIMFYIDIKKEAYIYIDRVEGQGGLPIGTSGRGISLLSGGIDSPVASYLMAKRGMKIDAVHFHSYPFTSERAELKVIELAEILSRYIGKFKVYSVNLAEIQKAINKGANERYMTVLSRRFMMRIAERVALKRRAQCLITGESLGQVASQTIEGITASNAVSNLPVLRPLIAYDKTDIIEIAKDIETFEKSIEPYEDCCTVFLPKHPVTRPKLEDVEGEEAGLDVDFLVEEALKTIKIIDIG
ncbi:MAG: tRNA 4-thiouridine(8) synthase ThiI [Tissierellia bacterium]|nr:tRNA 4-thiouridine(8) synthase ThiI [Tissierellia bacterium]